MPSFRALYNRYRPQKFEELVGQPHVVRTLQNALVQNRLSHAYLFSGDRGTGKTTVARLLAKAVNCLKGVQAEPCGICDHCRDIAAGTFLDLVELDAASHTGIDEVRELTEAARYAPNTARYKVYIIDEVHQLSNFAKDALLKTLEEPPARTLFILATTEPHKVPATIRSRCQHLTFRRIGMIDLVAQLRRIVEDEQGSLDEAALTVLARNAGGSLRDAVSLLDQALAFSEGAVTVEHVNDMLGLTSRDAVFAMLESLAAGDAAAGLHQVELAVQQGNSPGTLRQQLVDSLREILLAKTSASTDDFGGLTHDEAHTVSALGQRMDLRQIVRALEIFAEPEPPTRGSVDPALELELAFARTVLSMRAEAGEPSPAAPAAEPVAPTPKPVEPPRAPKPAAAADVAEQLTRGDDLSVENIRERADEWLAHVRGERDSLVPWVSEAQVVGFAGGVVTLGYRSKFLFERVDRLEARDVVTQALTRTFGTPLQVRNIIQEGVTQPRRAAPNASSDDDPVVRVAMRDYGAKRVEDDAKTGA